MKILRMMLCAVVLVALASCGGSKFDSAKAKELNDKITSNQELNADEQAAVIDLWTAAYEEQLNMVKDAGADPQKLLDLANNDSYKELAQYQAAFAQYLATTDLGENKAKYEEAVKKVADLTKQVTEGLTPKAE